MKTGRYLLKDRITGNIFAVKQYSNKIGGFISTHPIEEGQYDKLGEVQYNPRRDSPDYIGKVFTITTIANCLKEKEAKRQIEKGLRFAEAYGASPNTLSRMRKSYNPCGEIEMPSSDRTIALSVAMAGSLFDRELLKGRIDYLNRRKLLLLLR